MLPSDLLVSDNAFPAGATAHPKPIVRFKKVMRRSQSLNRPKTTPRPGRRAQSAEAATDETEQSDVQPEKVINEDSIRIVVVDDHPLFRHGLVQLLNSEASFFVCGEA